MLNKENVLKYINELPHHFSIDELFDRLLLLNKIEIGLEQSNKGQITPHKDVKTRLDIWLK